MIRVLLALLLIAIPVHAEDVDAGARLFGFHCASCHGAEAQGDGPLSEVLTIRPADLTTLSTGNGGTFPLARVLDRIDGTTEVMAHGGPMPVFGLILDGPSEVVLAPDGSDIAAPEALMNIALWLETVQR